VWIGYFAVRAHHHGEILVEHQEAQSYTTDDHEDKHDAPCHVRSYRAGCEAVVVFDEAFCLLHIGVTFRVSHISILPRKREFELGRHQGTCDASGTPRRRAP